MKSLAIYLKQNFDKINDSDDFYVVIRSKQILIKIKSIEYKKFKHPEKDFDGLEKYRSAIVTTVDNKKIPVTMIIQK